jgi:peroxiredoxin
MKARTRRENRAGSRAFCVAALALCVLAPARGEPAFAELTPATTAARPLFTLDSIAGGRIELAAHADRIVLVHFFATWCEPCRDEMARLQRLAARFTGQRLAILAVDVGEADRRVQRFVDANPVPFPVLLDRDSAVARAWQVATLPATVVLDRALAARFVAEGDVDWDRAETERKLAALVAEVDRMDLPSSPGRNQ